MSGLRPIIFDDEREIADMWAMERYLDSWWLPRATAGKPPDTLLEEVQEQARSEHMVRLTRRVFKLRGLLHQIVQAATNSPSPWRTPALDEEIIRGGALLAQMDAEDAQDRG